MWDLTEAPSLLAGTLSCAATPPIPCLNIPAHQSGVNSLVVWAEKLGQQEGSCLVTVASGGDDGQLTVSSIRVTRGRRGFSQISEPLIPLQTKCQPSEQLQIHLQSQFHIPLAHAAPLTALKLLSPGLVVSTSSDQRVCLWNVSSTGISHIRALCSHVADAAGLEVWEGQITEEEREYKKRKTRFKSEQEAGIQKGEGSQTPLKTMCETAEGETGGRSSKEKETTEGGEPVTALKETGDPICKTNNERRGETASVNRNENETDCVGKTGSEINSERKKREKMGWVLVCGQGFQLLRVINAEIDAEMKSSRRQREK